MFRPRPLPRWIRRGIEAGVLGAGLSAGTLLAFQLSRPAPRLALPNGIDGSLILTPAVVALGVFVVSYPTFLAATRDDAILGAVAAFLIAADAFMLVSLVAPDYVLIHPLGHKYPLEVVAAARSADRSIRFRPVRRPAIGARGRGAGAARRAGRRDLDLTFPASREPAGGQFGHVGAAPGE
jgi:hypothetical protein